MTSLALLRMARFVEFDRCSCFEFWIVVRISMRQITVFVRAYPSLNRLQAGEKLLACLVGYPAAVQIFLRFGLKGSVLALVYLDLHAAFAIGRSHALPMTSQLVRELEFSGFLRQLQIFVPKPCVEPRGFVCEEPLPDPRRKCAKRRDGLQQAVLTKCKNTGRYGDEICAAVLHMGAQNAQQFERARLRRQVGWQAPCLCGGAAITVPAGKQQVAQKACGPHVGRDAFGVATRSGYPNESCLLKLSKQVDFSWRSDAIARKPQATGSEECNSQEHTRDAAACADRVYETRSIDGRIVALFERHDPAEFSNAMVQARHDQTPLFLTASNSAARKRSPCSRRNSATKSCRALSKSFSARS